MGCVHTPYLQIHDSSKSSLLPFDLILRQSKSNVTFRQRTLLSYLWLFLHSPHIAGHSISDQLTDLV
jgi:hypothetical protein